MYLDWDKTGQNCRRYALGLDNRYKDESGLYKHYKDLNDWLMNMGKIEKNISIEPQP